MSALSWQRLDLDDVEMKGFEDGCMFELEEIKGDDYQIITSEGGAKMLQMKETTVQQVSPAEKSSSKNDEIQLNQDVVESKKAKRNRLKKQKKDSTKSKTSSPTTTVVVASSEKDSKDDSVTQDDTPYPEWEHLKLDSRINQALRHLKFEKPTTIQRLTIPPALVDNRDIVGAASTGSGKTLAYAIPIVQQLLSESAIEKQYTGCKALVLTPTRELAMQVTEHFRQITKFTSLRTVSIVGGMSSQKQARQLTYHPEIVVGTPGRLWDLVDSGHVHFLELNLHLRFFVIDEADRLVETGNYQEVEKFFQVLDRSQKKIETTEEDEEEENVEDDSDEEMLVPPSEVDVVMLSQEIMAKIDKAAEGPAPEPLGEDGKVEEEELVNTDNEEEEVKEPVVEICEPKKRRLPRQTFLFSATLSLSQDGRFSKKKKTSTTKKPKNMLESVMRRVGMRGSPAIVDITSKNSTDATDDGDNNNEELPNSTARSLPAGLKLCEIECVDEDRDFNLYYFLAKYPGRTIIFLNSIPQVRKLTTLLSLLKLPVFALHAEMQQRQRLKKLDGFKNNPNGILVATDVAARGLDIPKVQYVVHYHIPRSTEVFIHRSGRTARASQDGLSISFVSPADMKYHAQICRVLHVPSLDQFPIDYKYFPAVKERVRIASKIYKADFNTGKKHAERSWFAQMAEEADLPIDDELLNTAMATNDVEERNASRHVLSQHRAQLSRLLAAELRPVGSKRKFRNVHEDMKNDITASGDYRMRNATADLQKKKSAKRFRKRK